MSELYRLLDLQRRAFAAEMPVSLEVRRERLERAGALVRDNAERFCKAMSEDFGHRSREQSMIADIAATLSLLSHARKHVARWARRDRRPVRFPLGLLGAKAWVEYQPKGVVGVIAPWNFPVNLAIGPLASIFAAGNRAMVKLSEDAPATAALFQEVAPRFFAEDELAFITGGAEVGEAFAGLPFDHLLFTGSSGTGQRVLQAAARHLTPVTLELGGKSPAIIGSGANLAKAAERIIMGKLLNAGQICLAPDYVMVPAARESEIASGLRQAATALYPQLLANPDYTAIINDRHWRRLADSVEDARAKGATVEVVNPANEDFGAANSRKMPLHILHGVTDDMVVMQEEIFGPVLPIVTYRDIDNAIERVNAGDRPLALYYFGPDAGERRKVLDRTISGGVTLDDVIFHNVVEDLPFGGIGRSGMGAYHGQEGFKTFSHAKAVYRQSRLDVARLAGIKPPYGAATRKALARQIGKG